MPSQTTITVLVANDRPLILEGIRSILSKTADIKIIAEVQDGVEIKPKIEELHPQVLLMELIMPNLNPVEVGRWVQENHPQTATLVLTAHGKDAYLANMMEARAAGYLDKKLQPRQLISFIRRAARGEILFDKEQLDRAHRWREEVRTQWESLSDREREVLQALTEGIDNKGIAAHLGISVNTVEKHLKNIYVKLGVTSRTKAAHWWLERSTDFRT